MKLSTGGCFGEPLQDLTTDRIRCFASDGREMFEINIGSDGRSLEIIAGVTYRENGVMYKEHLLVEPQGYGRITIRSKPYDE